MCRCLNLNVNQGVINLNTIISKYDLQIVRDVMFRKNVFFLEKNVYLRVKDHLKILPSYHFLVNLLMNK